jgi:protein phosphatase
MDARGATHAAFSILRSCIWGKERDCLPSAEDVLDQIAACRSIFACESSLLQLNGSFVIVGDIHGNLADLVRIFSRVGYPPAERYLFVGDFVDRGHHSVEVMILLFALKILFPEHVFLVRGNHECDSLCADFGFKDECVAKMGSVVYSRFIECFAFLPYAALVNGSVLCLHGGISPEVKSLKNIADLPRPLRSYESEVANGIVWSDPRAEANGFGPNDRGTGNTFNAKVLSQFCRKNRLSLLIRGHEWCAEGYEWPFGTDGKCLTVFSSSDYCEMGNTAAVAKLVADGEIEFELFPPLTEEMDARNLVIFPSWILSSENDPMAGMWSTLDEIEDDQDRLLDDVALMGDFSSAEE